MSKIERYQPSGLRCTCCGKPDSEIQSVMVTHEKGRYVLFEDYAALDKLCKKLMKHHSDISCENIMLRKAGDAMAYIMAYENDSEFNGFVEAWNAAKEGKPSV